VARMLSPLLVVITCLFGATSAWPSTPRDELHRHIEELLNTVDDPSLTAEQRAVHARTTVLKMFDFSDTARRAFGSHWRRLTAAQRDETTGLVGGFLTEALVARVSRAPRRFADRMRDRMVYGTESVSGERATVSLTLARGQEGVPIVADLVRRGTSWRVYDLRLREVSLLDNYRAQLDRLMRRGTYEETIERLQTKREALRLTAMARGAAPKE